MSNQSSPVSQSAQSQSSCNVPQSYIVSKEDVENTQTNLEATSQDRNYNIDDLTRDDYAFIHMASSVIINSYLEDIPQFHNDNTQSKVLNCFAEAFKINNAEEGRIIYNKVFAEKTLFLKHRQEDEPVQAFIQHILEQSQNYKSSHSLERMTMLILDNTEC